jgi:hypothetical protein
VAEWYLFMTTRIGRFTDNEVDKMIRKADGDGKINYDEFKKMMDGVMDYMVMLHRSEIFGDFEEMMDMLYSDFGTE